MRYHARVMDPLSLLSKIANYVVSTRTSGAMATVIATSGSVPQKPGARIAVFADGRSLGTIGGGAIEQEVVRVLNEALLSGLSERMARHLTKQLGMCCGGEMEFFVEPLLPPPRLVLFGAGHIARPAAEIARAAGFQVCVVDDREEFNTDERFPGCTRFLEDGDSVLRSGALRIGPADYVVISTHSHRLDQDILGLCARRTSAFLGMVASRRKAKVISERLRLIDPTIDLSALRSPVGLDIGAVEPGEIAISIVAQLVECRRQERHAIADKKAIGIVLAAGASSRMGASKAELRLGKKTVLRTIVDTLKAGGCADVCVIVAPPHEHQIRATHPDLWCETNPTPETGMLGSVICGLRAARARGGALAVLALLDQPRVRPRTVELLLNEARTSDARYVVPQHDGRRGHPFVLDAGLDLTSPRGGATLRDILRGVDQLSVVDVDDLSIFDDLDTKEDAERLGVCFGDAADPDESASA